jgi:hypothetical protein
MKKIGYVLYMLAGAGLILSGFATTEKGLKEDNRREYDRVVEDYREIGNMGFEGFCPMDYKTAFSNGEKDYVLQYNNGDYKVEEREAVYDGLVGSVYQNGEEFEVVVPEYDTWISLGSTEQLSAVIWHESFHAYQNTQFNAMEKNADGVMGETELAEMIDGDAEKRKMYEKELEILSGIADEEGTCDAEEIALEYLKAASERDAKLSYEENQSENFYEMLEGSAYYIEANAVRYENGEEAFRANYAENTDYAEGNAKYYRHGMLQCMLLDELDPEWKTGYSFDKTFDEVIAEYVAK